MKHWAKVLTGKLGWKGGLFKQLSTTTNVAKNKIKTQFNFMKILLPKVDPFHHTFGVSIAFD